MQQERQKIPILDLSPEIDFLWEELNGALQKVLRLGQFINGTEVGELESELATFLGIKHAIALNSGTDALVIGLRALGLKPGDEVITTPFSFFATAEAISILGGVPIFVDIDPNTFNLDPRLIEAKITSRTWGILPVHLYGQPAALDEIAALAEAHGLKVLEDVAQAFGATFNGQSVGTFGQAAAYSFFPSKNLGAYGDSGMLATNYDEVAEMARMLRSHGSLKKYYNQTVGYNSRMDTLQAAILRVKLPHVKDWNAARRKAARHYNELLSGVQNIIPPNEAIFNQHVYHQYTVRILDGKRDAMQQHLKHMGIDTMVYYPVPVHKLPIYVNLNYHLAAAEQAANEVLSLPLWPQITPEIQARVVEAVRRFDR